jgi:hypothetical protein
VRGPCPQQDVMPPYWTVAEAVEFNHRLRIEAGGMSHEVRGGTS